MPIKNFKDDALRLVFEGNNISGWNFGSINTVRRRLVTIDSATSFNDFGGIKALKFEEVKQSVKGYKGDEKLWRVKINKQWSIVFRWKDGEAYDLGIANIH